MGRLIDIDSLKGCAIIRPTSHETIEHIKQFWDDCLNHDDIPTAFDTEKVVEQLEERKQKASGCFGVMCSDCKYTEECHEGEKGYKVAFDSAIDIVKKGGVE